MMISKYMYGTNDFHLFDQGHWHFSFGVGWKLETAERIGGGEEKREHSHIHIPPLYCFKFDGLT